MKLGKCFKHAALLAVMLACVLCSGMRVQAYGRIDVDRETSLSVFFGKGVEGFPGVEFRLYRIADVSDTARYTLTGAFEDYQVSLEGLDSSGWRALAETLSGYIARDGIVPDMTVTTDQAGNADFGSLETGLYLVEGESYAAGGYTYLPESGLVSLPGLDEETDKWGYDVSAVCKYEEVQDQPVSVSRKVIKIWEDGDGSARPDEISVQLLRDGVVADTVTLNKENNWQYTWTELDGTGRWQIVEYQVPEDYTVLVEQEGAAFVMTNTLQGMTPGKPDQELPQTGVLWWPVPLLAGTGLILFLTGWKKHEDRGSIDG